MGRICSMAVSRNLSVILLHHDKKSAGADGARNWRDSAGSV